MGKQINQNLFNDISIVVVGERIRGGEKYGYEFNTEHEAYAVIAEEMQECREEIKSFEDHLAILWQRIRSDDTSGYETTLRKLHGIALKNAGEAIQLLAVCEKALKIKMGGITNDPEL